MRRWWERRGEAGRWCVKGFGKARDGCDVIKREYIRASVMAVECVSGSC